MSITSPGDLVLTASIFIDNGCAPLMHSVRQTSHIWNLAILTTHLDIPWMTRIVCDYPLVTVLYSLSTQASLYSQSTYNSKQDARLCSYCLIRIFGHFSCLLATKRLILMSDFCSNMRDHDRASVSTNMDCLIRCGTPLAK